MDSNVKPTVVKYKVPIEPMYTEDYQTIWNSQIYAAYISFGIAYLQSPSVTNIISV